MPEFANILISYEPKGSAFFLGYGLALRVVTTLLDDGNVYLHIRKTFYQELRNGFIITMTVFKIKFDTTMYVASLSQLILFLRRDIPVEFELAVYDDDFKQ